MSLRQNKNIQSTLHSAAFVGIHAEHVHANKLFCGELHTDSGINVLQVLNELQKNVEQLKTELSSLDSVKDQLLSMKLNNLVDVNVTNAKEGNALVYENGKWSAAEILKEDEDNTNNNPNVSSSITL